ncbi:hypothetical protein QBC39DRAFT_304888 [Podospora conica]|nr:hypothetical protein QBC39DRAFT_304888 [Schizothecium conicum]
MTPDTTRSVDHSHARRGSSDLDVLVGLWEEARFPRLPCDAPTELRDLAEDIDNPKRVYVIHKASRRHNFQSLVQRYIVQLRDGCNDESCSKPTCFTFRKQKVGRAPIRRYNTTSARTLAIYLATQDNPENGLCLAPRPPKGPPAIANSLLFLASPRDTRSPAGPDKGASRGSGHKGKGKGPEASPGNPRSGGDTMDNNSASKGKARSTGPSENTEESRASRDPGFTVIEKPVSTDYRSFAANVFETVAFKMLEWLTPAAMEELSRKASLVKKESGASDIRVGGRAVQESRGGPGPRSDGSTSGKKASREKPPVPASSLTDVPKSRDQTDQGGSDNGEKSTKSVSTPKDDRQPPSLPPPAPQRRNSNAKVRTSSGPRTKRPLSVESFAPDPSADDPFPGMLRSPRANGGPTDKISRGIKTPSSALSRPISQISSALDGVPLETMPPPKSLDAKPKLGRSQLDGAKGPESASPKDAVGSGASSDRSCSNSSTHAADDDSELGEDDVYPQALSRLDPDVVDFMCNIIQQDGTAERHLLEPQTVTRFHNKDRQKRTLRRKTRMETAKMPNLKLEWKMFVDQTFFYVLSDPRLAIESFTSQGLFYDSHTLWYCMLRMTRIAPSLVFDALWMAAESLFAPPEYLRPSNMPKPKPSSRQEEPLSNEEAGRLISICLHALVAAAPLVDDLGQLYDMSRIRSHGLILAGSGAVAQQPTELCLQYEDVFADDMALRLARRVFGALSARNLFDKLNDVNPSSNEYTWEQDVLAPLFSQLDFFSAESAYKLEFSVKERGLHESRVPILLLDWARTVMIQDWNGTPEVRASGAFGGALALIDAMYKNRHELLLGDVQFRVEYIADRLDMVQVPIDWLRHTSTWRTLHLLDFPYLFSASTIVSYFRVINFARMSRVYEEASSYQEKIEVISHRFNFQPHHREVLTDRLQAATSKYLVLDISREEVLQDTFNQLWRREERELTKPFKVHLGGALGENGSDLGGVSQEFFRIAMSQALNPDFGAFVVDESTRMTWFVPGSVEPEWKFELVGLLVSLALYNGLTLPITFPRALYRKLLGEPVQHLHHIEDGWKSLAAGLTSLLDWDESQGSVEDVFSRTYEFSAEVYGQHITREMKPPPFDEWPQFPDASWASSSSPAPHEGNPTDDDDVPMVTNANRHAYVADYITWLTDVSVRRQYQAFERGFRRCLHPKSLRLLTPAILQSMVEGVQEIDLAELRRYTRYEGWDASHVTVKDFWSIVMEYDDEHKRKLLEFVTASDRVPVGGAKNILFVLQRHGKESGPGARLPTAYTCFGTLLLPEYESRERMKERLAMALDNAQGFGFA